MRTSNVTFLAFLNAALLVGCSDDSSSDDRQVTDRQVVELHLDDFTESLERDPPSQAELSGRIRGYLEENPTFFGSTVASLDDAGRTAYSPYVYRLPSGALSEKDLAGDPAYDIDAQSWLTTPIAAGEGVWSEPYFDTGGGDIWMVTRSQPVYMGDRVVAVATTDLAVEAPSD